MKHATRIVLPLAHQPVGKKESELDAPNFDDTEAANCLPMRMPAIMAHPYPYEFLLTPGNVDATQC